MRLVSPRYSGAYGLLRAVSVSRRDGHDQSSVRIIYLKFLLVIVMRLSLYFLTGETEQRHFKNLIGHCVDAQYIILCI